MSPTSRQNDLKSRRLKPSRLAEALQGLHSRVHHGIHKKNQTHIFKNSDVYFNRFLNFKDILHWNFFDPTCPSLVKTCFKNTFFHTNIVILCKNFQKKLLIIYSLNIKLKWDLESTSQGLFKYGLNFELIIFSILIILEKRKTKYPPPARNLNFLHCNRNYWKRDFKHQRF